MNMLDSTYAHVETERRRNGLVAIGSSGQLGLYVSAFLLVLQHFSLQFLHQFSLSLLAVLILLQLALVANMLLLQSAAQFNVLLHERARDTVVCRLASLGSHVAFNLQSKGKQLKE